MIEQTHNNITEDEFFDRFRPITNHLNDNAAFDGCMFETFGDEHAHVRQTVATAPCTVWTITDCDGSLYIQSGYHWVNRLGYLITAVACEPDASYDVQCENLNDNDPP